MDRWFWWPTTRFYQASRPLHLFTCISLRFDRFGNMCVVDKFSETRMSHASHVPMSAYRIYNPNSLQFILNIACCVLRNYDVRPVAVKYLWTIRFFFTDSTVCSKLAIEMPATKIHKLDKWTLTRHFKFNYFSNRPRDTESGNMDCTILGASETKIFTYNISIN